MKVTKAQAELILFIKDVASHRRSVHVNAPPPGTDPTFDACVRKGLVWSRQHGRFRYAFLSKSGLEVARLHGACAC